MTEQERKEWYDNQELYEMMVDLSKKLEATNAEMAITRTMIRDYNGLRGRLDKCEEGLTKICAQGQGRKDMWGYVVGAIGVLLALISAYVR